MLKEKKNAVEKANKNVNDKFQTLKAAMADYENAVANALLAKSEYEEAIVAENELKANAKFTIVVLDNRKARIVKKQFDSFNDAYSLCELDAYYYFDFSKNTEQKGLELSKTFSGDTEYDLVEVHVAEYEQTGTMIELDDGSFAPLTFSTTYGTPHYVIFSSISSISSFKRIPALQKYFVENFKK